MTLTLNHAFVSAISDDPAAAAAGEVVPSNWNAAHTINGGTPGSVLFIGAGGTLSQAAAQGTYLGQVATRSRMPNAFNNAVTQIGTRTFHIARDNITSLQYVIPNWYVTGGTGEVATGGTMTVTASVEYPAGVFTQITFSGSTSGSIASGNTLISDAATVTIPSGASFWSRLYCTNSAGILFASSLPTDDADGDQADFGNSVTDRTMGGTGSAASGIAFTPVAIIAQTSKVSSFILGDSRAVGINCTYTGGTGLIGEIEPSIGATNAFINASVSGDTAAAWLKSHTRRLALVKYCSHIISQLGINDINTLGTSAANTIVTLQQIWSLFSQPVTVCTLPPVSTSTDSWATVGNQTTASSNTQRVLFNDTLRTALPAGAYFYYEIANQVESATDSGKWKAPGYTADGIHEQNLAATAILSSGAVTVPNLTSWWDFIAPRFEFSGTQGSIIFAGPGGVLTQDNAALFWNDSSQLLTITGAANGGLFLAIPAPGLSAALIIDAGSGSSGSNAAIQLTGRNGGVGTSAFVYSDYSGVLNLSSANGQVQITSSVTSFTGINLNNTSSGGKQYTIESSGSAGTHGPGLLEIIDQSGASLTRYLYNGTNTLINFNSTTIFGFASDVFNNSPDVAFYRHAAGQLEINSTTTGTYRDLIVRDLFTNDASFMIRTQTTLSNGAAANTATLTNAPASGNPTKWISIDDNGTTRKIPAW